MADGRGKRLLLIAAAMLTVLIASGIIGFRVALHILKARVESALGLMLKYRISGQDGQVSILRA